MTHALDRRTFLRTVGASAAGGALAAGACQPILAAGSAQRPQTPKFRFVQWNDTHVQSPLRDRDGPALQTYARANEKLQWCVETVNRELKPDFVLGLGDLIHGERLDRLPLDLEQFQTLTKPLQAPLYPTPGNHETVQQEGHPDYERAYRAVFGDALTCMRTGSKCASSSCPPNWRRRVRAFTAGRAIRRILLTRAMRRAKPTRPVVRTSEN